VSADSARDPRAEAERLVAAALATASVAARSLGHVATGSGECCVCPVCKGIAAVREPSPEFAERLATAAGDLAAGVASVLRAFSAPDRAPAGATAPGEPASSPDDSGTDHSGTDHSQAEGRP
jgi:hypothetical protein